MSRKTDRLESAGMSEDLDRKDTEDQTREVASITANEKKNKKFLLAKSARSPQIVTQN